MTRRIELQYLLENELESKNVYFQPPETIKMKYPAIVYELSDISINRANNEIYSATRKYSITIIDKNPDSIFVDKILRLPMCEFNRHFESENLNHYVFNLYF